MLIMPVFPAVIVVCMRYGAKRTAGFIHSALARGAEQPPVVLGVSVDAITSMSDLAPQDVLLDVVTPAISALLFEGRGGTDTETVVHSRVQKGLRDNGLKAQDYELFYAGDGASKRPPWSPPPNAPACENRTPDLTPTNLYMEGDGEMVADTLELHEDMEDLEEDFLASDVGVSAEASFELWEVRGARVVQIWSSVADDLARCRSIALKVCQSFLAEKRFKLVWRVTSVADLKEVEKRCRDDNKLLLWIDVTSTGASFDKELKSLLKKYKRAKAVLTAPSQEPWSELDAKGYKAIGLVVSENAAAASGYHDDLDVTPCDSAGHQFNPIDEGYSAEEIKAFLNTALTEHKLAGAVIDDDGTWIFRIGVTDIAQLHRLRQKVLEGTHQDAREMLEGAFVQIGSSSAAGIASPTPSPPPSPPAARPQGTESSTCTLAMRALCGICLGTRREDEQRLLAMGSSMRSPDPPASSADTAKDARDAAPALSAKKALVEVPTIVASDGGGGGASDAQRKDIYWTVNRAKFAEMYERTLFSLEKLTPHQTQAFRKAQRRLKGNDGSDAAEAGGRGVHIKASAGAGKTFIALHMVISLLMQARGSASDEPILFVAPSDSLAIFVFKWIYHRLCKRTDRRSAKKKLCDQQGLLALVSPFHDGPRAFNCQLDTQTIEFAACTAVPTSYRLLVMDEAHHLLGTEAMQQHLEPVMGKAAQLMLLSDISQARAGSTLRLSLASSLLTCPPL